MSNNISDILANVFSDISNAGDVKKGIYIFGTGQGGKDVFKKLYQLNDISNGNYIIKGFFDNDRSKQGSYLAGLKIIEPHVIEPGDVILIASLTYDAEIFKQLIDLGINEKQIVPAKKWICDPILGYDSSKYAAFIDIVDTCNLRCATCFRSTIKGTAKKMELALFCRILDKLQALNTQIVGLYNWSEPFLHSELVDFVGEVKRRSMICSLSSNFAFSNISHVSDVLDILKPEDGDSLLVSISGIQQNIYEINHIGGNIETVKRNIEIASKSKNKAALRVKFLKFDYNQEEEEKVIEFCKSLGVSYEIINAAGNPLSKEMYKPSIEDAYCSRDLKSIAPCVFIFNQMVLDVNGEAYLCCCAPPHQNYSVGSFVGQNIAEITLKRYFHPVCAVCKRPSRRNFSEENLRLIKEGLLQVHP